MSDTTSGSFFCGIAEWKSLRTSKVSIGVNLKETTFLGMQGLGSKRR